MRVRYRKTIGVLFLLAGLGMCGMNLFAHHPLGLLSGFLICGLGILYLVRPYFYVEGDRVVVKALLGPAKKIYALQTERLKVHRWLADQRDWRAFLQHIEKDTLSATTPVSTPTGKTPYLVATAISAVSLAGMWQLPRWMAPRIAQWQTENVVLPRFDQLAFHLAEWTQRLWPVCTLGILIVAFGGAALWSRRQRCSR